MLTALEAVRPDVTAEYLGGTYIVNAAASGPHTRALFAIADLLATRVPSGYERATDIRVEFDDQIIMPDLCVIEAETLLGTVGDAAVPLSELLLMVEVLSPSTESRDRTVKKELCAAAGVDYWLVSPGTTLADHWQSVERFDFGGGVIGSVGL